MVSPLFHLFHYRPGKTGQTVAARSENVFFGWRRGRKMGKKACRLRCTPFLRTVSELKVCSEGTESVSLQSVFLKLVRHAELYAGDAVLVGAIASHIAGHGFPFIIGTGDHAIK